MAIFPFSNAYVINEDAVAGSSFKAGMILVTNSAGNVVPADSQLLLDKSLSEKKLSIIGIAAGDSNISGNTIIVPDYIGSNYLDSNSNFVSISDREYFSVKRQLLDYADETVNEYYNINYSPKPKRRGIGVYPLKGDTFATDQFSPVLHGDYGLDSSTTITFSPGDPLTFGGGINAGKLVKVNLNSFGPDVLVVGVVDRYNSSTGLLYYTQASYGLSFPQTDIIYLDAAVSLSYPGSGLSMYDLSTSGYTYDIINGTSFVSAGTASYFNFDGTDDRIRSSAVSLSGLNITILAWVWRNGPQNGYAGIVFDRNPGVSGLNIGPDGSGTILGYHWNGAYYNDNSLIAIPNQSWALVSMAINSTSATFGCNGTYNTLNNSHASTSWSTMTIGSDVASNPTGRGWNGRIGQAIMLAKTMTNAEVTAYFNLTKGRYGL